MDIGEAIVNAAKRLPGTVIISKIKPGDRVKFKAIARFKTRVTTCFVTGVFKGAIEVKYQGLNNFILYPGEIIEHFPKGE